MRKCPYCDFNSHELKSGIPEDAYVNALLADLDFELSRTPVRRIETIFIGGGTPSLFSASTITRLLTGIRAHAAVAPDAEITLEANPGSSEAAKFAGFREAGVNRLSIGVQSFQPHLLSAIGRIHDANEALAAARAARAAGFENFNLDLMFALPGQTPAEAVADIEIAIALDPAHLSCYQLTIEPETYFARRRPSLPDEDSAFEMQEAIRSIMRTAGYEPYEVSAGARPNARCRHNLNYWTFGDYLGIGAGAHGKLTTVGDAQGRASAAGGTTPRMEEVEQRLDDSTDGGGRATQDAKAEQLSRMPEAAFSRRWKLKSPGRFIAAAGTPAGIAGEETLDADTVRTDFLMNALRLNEGFEESLFTARTGQSLAALEPALSDAIRDDLLQRAGGRIRATERGRRFLNELLIRFLPEAHLISRVAAV